MGEGEEKNGKWMTVILLFKSYAQCALGHSVAKVGEESSGVDAVEGDALPLFPDEPQLVIVPSWSSQQVRIDVLLVPVFICHSLK